MTPGEAVATMRRLADSGDRPGLDRFLEAATFPLVDGAQCTFVWRGDAERVLLRHWIFALPSSLAFERFPGTDVWHLTIDIPARSRVEYKLEIVRGPHVELVEDPKNPNRAHDPFGANSVVHGFGYEVPDWTREDPEARPGTMADALVPSAALRRDEPVSVYLPARFRRTRRYPVLIVHDGGDYLRYAALKTVLDNLIHRLEIPEMIVAATHPRNRLEEYADHPDHARFLAEDLLPFLDRDFPLADRASDRCLMGASFGAVAAFSAACRYPGFYGRLLLQSGSFAFTDIGQNRRGPLFDPVVTFMNGFRDDPKKITEKIYMSCGTYESLIYENRSLVPMLQAAGMTVRYAESRDGHNWENWRDRLREGLSWLFPGPLWMVYE